MDKGETRFQRALRQPLSDPQIARPPVFQLPTTDSRFQNVSPKFQHSAQLPFSLRIMYSLTKLHKSGPTRNRTTQRRSRHRELPAPHTRDTDRNTPLHTTMNSVALLVSLKKVNSHRDFRHDFAVVTHCIDSSSLQVGNDAPRPLAHSAGLFPQPYAVRATYDYARGADSTALYHASS